MSRSPRSEDGSITDLGGGRFRVRVTVGSHPKTGKQIRVSKTIHGTRSDAKALRDRLNRQKGIVPSSYAKMSVAAFILEEWLPTRHLRKTTLAGYMATIDNHIVPRFSSVKLKDLTPLYITRMLGEIANAGAALNAYKMLRAALNVAVDNDVLPKNPLDKVSPPELEDYEADVYSLEELLTMLEHVRGSAIEQGILVAATCGLRASETCALDWQGLVLQRISADDEIVFQGHLSVHGGYHRVAGDRHISEPKSKRSRRVVAIPGFAVERLLDLRGDGRIGPLMLDATGQRMTPGGFTSRWRRLMLPRRNKGGDLIYEPPVRYIELKNLRHSQSTILLDAGATMHEVSRRDGHSTERVTDRFYNRVDRVQADHDVAKILDTAVRTTRGREDAENRRARPNSS